MMISIILSFVLTFVIIFLYSVWTYRKYINQHLLQTFLRCCLKPQNPTKSCFEAAFLICDASQSEQRSETYELVFFKKTLRSWKS